MPVTPEVIPRPSGHWIRPGICLILLLAACADFPNLEGAISDSARNAPYPRIAPIEGLIVAAIGPTRGGEAVDPTSAAADPLQARIDALRRRAAVLRGAPVNDQTRATYKGS